jgi:hypothetical protein
MALLVLSSSLLSPPLLLWSFCDHSVHWMRVTFGLTLVVLLLNLILALLLRSSVLHMKTMALVLLLGFSVLHTKATASVLLLGSSVRPTKPSPPTLASVLSSGKFLFCSTICRPFLILHFTHSTSSPLSYPADCYFSALLCFNLP